MKPVFEITNLTCEYLPEKPVLHIKSIQIPRGKLIFVIGESGIGKSTFIETLGFMNKTISVSNGLSLKYRATGEAEPVELKNHWTLTNDDLSDFRRANFSFIFQNTNLMPNFTAGENMMFSLLLQGKAMAESKERVLQVMKLLSLDESIFEKKITELSGGQRQRLAFVRAITSEFNVLFGDEPTGNLDERTAADLMVILKKILIDDDKTGIIVSHDLDLALEFADVIIPITRRELNEKSTVGEIDQKNIVQRNEGQWQIGGKVCPDPRSYVNGFLNRKGTLA